MKAPLSHHRGARGIVCGRLNSQPPRKRPVAICQWSLSRETLAVAVESSGWQDPAEVRRMEQQVAHEVVAEVDVRPRNVVVLQPGTIPKTPSGKVRRAHTLVLVN